MYACMHTYVAMQIHAHVNVHIGKGACTKGMGAHADVPWHEWQKNK